MEAFAERVVHLDMDAFFVNVERRRDPGLRHRAVVVGGAGPRGVVASASYEARRLGVRSAMPMAQARRLAPGLVVVPPDHHAYREASADVFAVLDSFTPEVEPLGLDEAFMDIRGRRLHYRDPQECAEAMRARIREATGLPSSAGLATSKLLAKMASRDAKPDGLCVVAAGAELEYLHPRPVRALWGVGEATYARLEELGVSAIGDIASFPRATLVGRLGRSVGGTLWDLATGNDPRMVGDRPAGHSVSVEQTYDSDISDPEEMDRCLVAHAERLAARMRREGVRARTINLKVRYPDFTTITRSHTATAAVAASADLLEVARVLLARTEAAAKGVRLLGLGADGMQGSEEPRQLGLEGARWEAIDAAVDRIRSRFGSGAVGRASLRPTRPGGVPDPSSR